MKPSARIILSNRFRLWILSVLVLCAPSLIANTLYDASKIGIQNTNVPSEGSKTYGPENNRESSLRKIEAAQEITRQEIKRQFCDQSPGYRLCATLPNDNTDFSKLFVYLFISEAAQKSFDVFSWQSFVGLNWPAAKDGLPITRQIGAAPNLARVWNRYATPREIFDAKRKSGVCAQYADDNEPYLETETFLQTDDRPLIDKNLNYVVYDVRINDVLANYIRQNNLHTRTGQQAFLESGAEIDYPVGFYSDPVARSGGAPGSVAIKTAWKIIDADAGDDPARYYTINGLIPVAAEHSESGKPVCLRERLALVGMHIMTRTESGSGRNWTWSTFEHVDNAPLANNHRRPTDILQKTLFEGGCKGPEKNGQDYAFFDANCPDCATNHIDKGDWKWSARKPYAQASLNQRRYGTQVVRCWDIFEGTQLINNVWREKLDGTVWANYQLLSAQWKGGNRGMMFPEGEVPRFLTNPTLETYSQYSPTSSCLSCHATARSLVGQDAKFSFVLTMPARFEPTD